MSKTIQELVAMANAYGDAAKHIASESQNDAFIYCDSMRQGCEQLQDDRSQEELDAEVDAFDLAEGQGRR